ncbi:hypothetical protein M9H77_07152 [Catharanthus roseus]|uniref:Uncharacterized protein n=1 Tax=Catharanthus roseus TaxID=4058 RepID=A0ACC0BUD7_CATRO|nr:hypothetical protein M9H77_07152 [Catharanthus roseus]
MVKSSFWVSVTGNNVYTLGINNKSCSCGKWQTYTLLCSHVLAVCRENRPRADTYVPEIYSRQTYRITYQANFHPVLSENFWRDVPFNLTFYPTNMKKEWRRKQGKRFQGEMDYRNPDSPPSKRSLPTYAKSQTLTRGNFIMLPPNEASSEHLGLLKLGILDVELCKFPSSIENLKPKNREERLGFKKLRVYAIKIFLYSLSS